MLFFSKEHNMVMTAAISDLAKEKAFGRCAYYKESPPVMSGGLCMEYVSVYWFFMTFIIARIRAIVNIYHIK